MGILALVIAAVFAALFFASKKAAPPCRLLAPSALAICACALCLSATTYAWFTATSTSTVAKIESATYDVTVNGTPTTDGVYTVMLDGSPHSITIKPAATSTASVGYCEIKLGDSISYTSEIPKTGEGSTFTFTISGFTGQLTITPMWGELPEGAATIEGTLSSGTATTTDLFMMPEPPETPEPTPEAQPETPENPDDTYLVQDDTEPPETDPEPSTE